MAETTEKIRRSYLCENFMIPKDARKRAYELGDRGIRVVVAPWELMELMVEADKALNSGRNDAEHDALYAFRERLSEIYEDPDRRTDLDR